jgi:outer membrane protein
MKKLLILGLLVFVPASLASADLKIATVDLGQAFDAYYKTKEDISELKEKELDAQKDVQAKNAAYELIGEDVTKLDQESKDPTLSAEARTERAKARDLRGGDLDAARRSLSEFVDERKKELQDEYLRRRNNVVAELTKIITDYSSAQGYDLVLDKTSASVTSGVPIVLFSSGKLPDITADVIKQENAGAPATSSVTIPEPASTH